MCDGSTVGLRKIAVLEGIVSHIIAVASAGARLRAASVIDLSSILAAEMIDEPENQADEYANHQARDQRKIKCAMLAAIADVSRQTAEAQREFRPKIKKRTDDDEYCTDGKEQASELLRWFHDGYFTTVSLEARPSNKISQ